MKAATAPDRRPGAYHHLTPAPAKPQGPNEATPQVANLRFRSKLHVCFWRKADIPTRSTNVRFRG